VTQNEDQNIPVIAFVGRSGCGKTTILENVIPLLLQDGIRLSVVKHTRHKHLVTDVAGTDTLKMWEAGVPNVVLVAADRVVQWQRYEEEPDVNAVLKKVTGVDMIILEGFKSSGVPKIEVLRQAHHPHPLTDIVSRLAYITDREDLETDLPCFELDDFKSIANFLRQFAAW
jgi:molybdopterin-guanine dinucleotide biosynthesis protein B